MFLRMSVLTLFLAAAIAPLNAAEVNLSPRYEKGDQLEFEVEVGVDQTLTLAGMNIETSVSTFEIRKQEVTETTADGGSKHKHQSSKLQFNLNLPGGITVSFDSDNPDQESEIPELNEMLKMLKVVSKMEMTMELDKHGHLEELSIEAEGIDQLSDAMKVYVEGDSVKKQLKQELNRLPEEAVESGETWTRSEIFDAGNGQLFTYTTTYTYEGQVQEKGKTFDKVTAKFAKPRFEIQAGSSLPIGVKSSELSMEGSSATLLFDVERHLLQKSSGKSIFKGKIVFTDPNGNEIPGELDLTISSKLTRRAK